MNVKDVAKGGRGPILVTIPGWQLVSSPRFASKDPLNTYREWCTSYRAT